MKKSTLEMALKALNERKYTFEERLERGERNLRAHIEQTSRAGEKPYEKVVEGHKKRKEKQQAELALIEEAINELEELK